MRIHAKTRRRNGSFPASETISGFSESEYFPEFVIAELGDPAFARGDGEFGERLRAFDERVDFFFEFVLFDAAVYDDVPVLPYTVGAVRRLGFHGGVPPQIVMDDLRSCGEVEPRAACLEGKNENAALRIALELFDDGVPFRETFSHFYELRKNEHFFVRVEDRARDVEEQFHFAGKLRRRLPVFQVLRRVVADLLEREDELKHDRAALEKLLRIRRFECAERVHRLVESFLVERRLRRRKLRPFVLLQLFGKIGENALVRFETAEQKRSGDLLE